MLCIQFEINRFVVLGDDRDLAVFYYLSRPVGQRLDLDEPLRGKPRLNHRPAAIALPDRDGVVLLRLPGNPAFRRSSSTRSRAAKRLNPRTDPRSDSCARVRPSRRSAAGYGATRPGNRSDRARE